MVENTTPRVFSADGTEIQKCSYNEEILCNDWSGLRGPPVPVIIDKAVWDELISATISTPDPVNKPRVFRLFMKRGKPRHVIKTNEIKEIWRNSRGVIRWKKDEYKERSEPTRKGGNAFIHGDVKIQLVDAYWMGKEQTDLRISMVKEQNNEIRVSAWWSRGGTSGLSGKHETDGELWPVKLLIK